MSEIFESLEIRSRPGNNTGLGTLVAQIDKDGVQAHSPTKLMTDSNIMHDKMLFNLDLVAATISRVFFIVREGRWRVSSVTEYHQTGSTSGTLTVTVDAGTNAPGAGTAQLSATLSLAAATQQVIQNGALITTPTVAGPGNRFAILIAGTMTSLAGGAVTVALERVG